MNIAFHIRPHFDHSCMGADPKSVGAGGYVVIEYMVDLQNTAVVAVFLEVEIKGVLFRIFAGDIRIFCQLFQRAGCAGCQRVGFWHCHIDTVRNQVMGFNVNIFQ